MLLYHYSKAPLGELRTSESRGVVTPEQRQRGLELVKHYSEVAPYYQHISFFFDAIPADILGTLFAKHPEAVWRTGDAYYEHVIDTKDIEEFKYRIVETSVVDDDGIEWPGDDASPIKKQAYFAELYEHNLKAGYIGFNNYTLERTAKRFVGNTRNAFIHATQNPFTADSLKKYAADVPHLMLYPAGGSIRVIKAPRKIKIGNGTFAMECIGLQKPLSARW